MSEALISNIQGYSIHDGPGIRTTVFVQGCPLRCRWCANPENLSRSPKTGFLSRLCRSCGTCLTACSKGAVLPGPRRIDREKCDNCGDCVKVCDTGALVQYGSFMEAGDVFEQVKKDDMFYRASGGGVTVSGGEPFMWPEFLEELFSLCRGAGIHTCVETCACVSPDSIRALIPLTDMFYCDLKIMDPELHREQTGADNALILENARLLAAESSVVCFRKPLIPGVNDCMEDISATSSFLKELGVPRLELMPYHRAGKTKYEALDMSYATGELSPLSPAEAEETGKLYISYGIKCTVSR
ncbi:MAG: glycyl-radical enzyme activating protein [Oscillospiraceae bacterium]|nr:glycyl-radical enzyme activating protein [Oscillospiraceae bacterium]